MADSMNGFVGICFMVFILLLTVSGRKHTLKLTNDGRKTFAVSTFGFLKGGHLEVHMVKMTYTKNTLPEDMFGFTIDKSSSKGTSSYMEKNTKECVLYDGSVKDDKTISVVTLGFNTTSSSTETHKIGDDITGLVVTSQNWTKYTHAQKSVTHAQQSVTLPTQSTTIARHKRKATVTPTKSPKVDPSTTKVTTTTPTHQAEVIPEVIPVLVADKTISLHFLMAVNKDSEEGLYNLYFHNCHNYRKFEDTVKVNLTLVIIEKNPTSYLSAGKQALPSMYFVLCVVFFLMACFWLRVLRKSGGDVYKIHYLMLVLVYMKSLSLLFHAMNYYYIGKEGTHEAAWAVLYYITHLLKGALLFITIILIGAGWAFIKHILSDRDKKIFLVVLPLQILANVATIIMEETEEGQVQHTWWNQIFIMVDLICCGAIIFPVVWSIRHLTEASQTDGKAALNLQKLKLFRHFYILVVCYIYFTRIIVYLMQITVPFRYMWIEALFKELGSMAFFVITGYSFRPASDNPYLQVPVDSDDDEVEMDEVLTKSGALTTVVRVNKDVADNVPKQRESSHEYD